MDEDTTTTQDVAPDTGAEQALPVDVDTADVADVPAVAEPSDESQDVEQVEIPTDAPKADDKLRKYAQSNGIELDSPGAIRAAEIAMKNQAEASRNYRKTAELEKNSAITQEQLPADATTQDVENARLRNLELKYEIQGWKMNNADKLALEPQMIEVLADPTKKYMVQEGLLSMDDVYALARAKAPDNAATVKSQGRREALESLAHKQQAAVPKGNATNPGVTPKNKPFSELSISEMEARLGTVRR